MAAKETREFGGTVPLEEYELFREAFPQYGATNWFINHALKAFNQQIRENPILKTGVDQAIDSMLDDTLRASRGVAAEREANAADAST